jgi:Protein of unknown function (DUF3224)
MGRMNAAEQATGTFEVESWDEQPYHEEPRVRLSRTRLTKKFAGDLVGTSVVDMLAVSLPVEGSGEYQGAAYVAVERITGSVHGRAGGFVATHGTRGPNLTVSIVPGSGSGELSGISGEITIVRHADGSHGYTLAYRLD